ncbi:MAG: phage tail protein [Clostridiales bacterium]|nr:phage tail protein [Clostridiales bacterium]
MAKQPEAYIDFEVYEGKTNYMGIARATLPNINYLTQQITGAGIAGNVEAVLTGMVDAMSLTLEFRSATDAAVTLMKPVKHEIDLRVAEQYWDTVKQAKQILADKYVMTVVPKNFSPGSIAPASAADTSSEYSVYYYAGFKNNKKLWEIDPFNYICNVGGKDYMADVRKALGK